ncbi:MAG TPA: hypothetical protein VGP68_04460, partial [Gemmataceae bacterium]|nr:hypothetical protein [Gemmataceae bacterium]
DARWTVKYTKAKPNTEGMPRVDLAVPAFGGTIGNFVRRLGMIGAKELENAATQGTPHPGCHP